MFIAGCPQKAKTAVAIVAEPTPRGSDINLDFFCKEWLHSPEEQEKADADQIYRPKSFKEFPPSRFRMQYIFQKSGDCEWYYLSPDDNHRLKPCKWKIDSKDKNILNITKEELIESYKIIELTKDKLRIKEIVPNVDR